NELLDQSRLAARVEYRGRGLAYPKGCPGALSEADTRLQPNPHPVAREGTRCPVRSDLKRVARKEARARFGPRPRPARPSESSARPVPAGSPTPPAFPAP